MKLYKLMEENKTELYPDCKKFIKLSFIIRLFTIKCLGGSSNKSCTMLLELLNEALPEGNTLLVSYYELKKITSGLGFDYEKIDACLNDYMLYWKTLQMIKRILIVRKN